MHVVPEYPFKQKHMSLGVFTPLEAHEMAEAGSMTAAPIANARASGVNRIEGIGCE